ncbi:DNA integrity scanning protein DisA nucleotide-binding domain protein [Natronomonas halophila]|uniref:diadenylate cyclase n=1 Tax=Natronomonas halophila TaxID=2747817 RepID=UPI0015B52407|nr:diadenylate cyclase [Natronomonas halophila]QLD86118.1 DNA integrity scanning protein DisA nucleotide-binding domain protein [Natronomonas halophila]
MSGPLAIDYRTHHRVDRMQAVIRYCLEGIAMEFGRWEDTAGAPGAYLALVSSGSVADFADPMGDNHWPETGREPLEEFDAFYESLRTVAQTCDGAAVVGVDGVINEQLVRFRSPAGVQADYEPWMGARHMSALDVSTREDVVVTLTLSEETGRVTVFQNGTFESVPPERFGERWRGTQ